MMDPTRIGKRLKEYMIARGMSTNALAEKVGVTDVTIRNWKSGRTSMTLQHAEQVASALGIKIDDLLN